MLDVKKSIEEVLKKIGIEEGDIVLIHSDSTAIKKITGLQWARVLNLINDCFINMIGESGTLIVPTFNWDFCKGKTYSHKTTPSQVGMFSNYVLFNKNSIRSLHPIYSFAGIGPAAKDIFSNISKSSYGKNSVFHKLHQKNAKIISFCIDPNIMGRGYTTTFIHYVEQMKSIDYRFIKHFSGTVNLGDIEYDDIFDLYVRFKDDPVELDGKKILHQLLNTRKLKREFIDDIYPVSQISCNDLYDEIMKMLYEAPYSLLQNPPKQSQRSVN